MNRFGLDDVRGEIIGDISHDYTANLVTVERWPAHGSVRRYPVRLHRFSSCETDGRKALATYCATQRRESKLGDGTPCVVTLELA